MLVNVSCAKERYHWCESRVHNNIIVSPLSLESRCYCGHSVFLALGTNKLSALHVERDQQQQQQQQEAAARSSSGTATGTTSSSSSNRKQQQETTMRMPSDLCLSRCAWGSIFIFFLSLCACVVDSSAKGGIWQLSRRQYTNEEDFLVAIPDHVDPPSMAKTREERFPSREDRLKVYMSNWYVPPCPDYHNGMIRYEYHNGDNDNDAAATTNKKKNNHNSSSTSSSSSYWPTLTVHTAHDLDPAVNTTRQLAIESAIVPDTAFYVDAPTVLDCLKDDDDDAGDPHYKHRIQFRKNMNMYCTDAASTVLTALSHVDWEQQQQQQRDDVDIVPTIMQFGDLKHSHTFGHVNVPLLKKFRSAAISSAALQETTTTSSTMSQTSSSSSSSSSSCYKEPRPVLRTVHDPNATQHLFQPIVWKLASRRHFGNLERVYREDTSWENKNNMAVFRGQMTGTRNDGYNKHLDDETNCLLSRRCRLVYTHYNSTLVHARLTSTRKRLPNTINGINLVASAVTLRRLLAFKAIIMLEGNDVASGLKWALLSQSVVLMPIPKHTSWAMEELLEPWVHYIPLNDNATDVEEKMQWVVDHDEAARRIAERGSMWMEDLVFHPDAAEDDRWIQEEIIRRYRKHFSKGL